MDWQQIFTQYYGFDWLAILFGVIGVYKLGNKERSGFIFYMLAALAGLVFAFLAKSIPYLIINSIIVVLQLRGYLKWGKE